MIKLEAGKCYRTRGGRKVGPMKTCGVRRLLFECDGVIWFADGSFHQNAESSHDLIAEWVDSNHIERTKRMIEVMQAYVDGEEIQRTYNGLHFDDVTEPNWCWGSYDYRIAEPKTPDSINWDHVAPEFKYMARDECGEVWLFKNKPVLLNRIWYDNNSSMAKANTHVSYSRGTIDWKDSLVMRLGVED